MSRALRNIFRLLVIARILARHDALFPFERLGVARPLAVLARLVAGPKVVGRKNADRPGKRLARALHALGPAFIKLGQVLSTRADLVGEETIAADLSDPAGPAAGLFTSAEARASDRSASSARPVEALFAEFEETPVAAASIAQVHISRTAIETRRRYDGKRAGRRTPECRGQGSCGPGIEARHRARSGPVALAGGDRRSGRRPRSAPAATRWRRSRPWPPAGAHGRWTCAWKGRRRRSCAANFARAIPTVRRPPASTGGRTGRRVLTTGAGRRHPRSTMTLTLLAVAGHDVPAAARAQRRRAVLPAGLPRRLLPRRHASREPVRRCRRSHLVASISASWAGST